MSDIKKYYYLKLKDNFFDTDEIIILESMQDGYLYSNILLKLYLRSLKYDGRLMFNERIPFNSTMLSQVTRHSVGVIEKAMQIFQELNLVEVLDNGAIYMNDIQNFIGQSSTEGDRKRQYRKRIENEKNNKALPNRTDVQTDVFDGTNVQTNVQTDVQTDVFDGTNVQTDIQTNVGQTTTRDRDRDRDRDIIDIEKEVEVEDINARAREGNNPPLPPSESNYVKKYKELIRPNASNLEIERLISYEAEEGINGELIEVAIEEAVLNNKPSLSYIRAILERCLSEGVSTPEQFKAKKEAHKSTASGGAEIEKNKQNNYYRTVDTELAEEFRKMRTGEK